MQCDALTKWPFLADIKLPEDMWWGAWGDDPCIHGEELYLGWISSIYGGYVSNEITWFSSDIEVKLPEDTLLQDLCIALANFAWTQS